MRGSERAGAVGDLARGLYPPPRHSPLRRSARWLTAFLLVSSSPRRSSALDYLREGDGEEGGGGPPATLPVPSKSGDLAGALHSTCIPCNETSNTTTPPTRPISFPSPTTDNWRKLYAGVRRWRETDGMPFFPSIVLICSACCCCPILGGDT